MFNWAAVHGYFYFQVLFPLFSSQQASMHFELLVLVTLTVRKVHVSEVLKATDVIGVHTAAEGVTSHHSCLSAIG